MKSSRNDDDDDDDDDSASTLYIYAAQALRVKCDIEPALPTARKRKSPQQFAACVAKQSVGQPDAIKSQIVLRQPVSDI